MEILHEKKTLIYWITFFLIAVIYLYLRVPAFLTHTVSYTYDQGRDFLKAEEIVRFHNLTFIGPTTGIDGLFHGVWWYYLLAIPYFLFNGTPISFYWFLFVFTTTVLVSFIWFLKKEFGAFPSILFAILVTISPYFIGSQTSTGNNHIVPSLILLLIFSTYYLIKTAQLKWFFFVGLLLALIFEFEVAFGLFLIPVFIICSLLVEKIRKGVLKVKNLLAVGLGLFIPVVPRLLFEIKNNFLQTKTIFGFFIHPKLHNPKPFNDILHERIALFIQYFQSSFFQNSTLIALLAILTILAALLFFLKKSRKVERENFVFTVLLLIGLFLISLTYKDNFWGNYYEGIQYFMLYILVLAAAFVVKQQKIRIGVLVVLLALSIFAGYQKSQERIDLNGGLSRAERAMGYIYDKVGKEQYCLRAYTPPVIIHTYNYLSDYNSNIGRAQKPSVEYVNNECWYIIEADPFSFRQEAWKKSNIPEKAQLIEKKSFGPELVVARYRE